MVIWRAFLGRPRLLIAAAIGLAASLLPPGDLGPTVRFLIGWNCTATVWLALVAAMMAQSDEDGMQRRADEDVGALAILVLAVAAAVVSLAAIGIELAAVKSQTGGGKALGIGLASLTILTAWLFTHTMFAIHYAHDFYRGPDDQRGLDFPGTERPDYWDFLYYAITIGAAAQTSDVQVTARRMRRFTLAQTVLAFLFNTTVLALAINVGAGLL